LVKFNFARCLAARRFGLGAFALVGVVGLSLVAVACGSADGAEITVVETPISKTIIDQNFEYPADGDARVISRRLTVPPGAETDWHTHDYPLLVYIISGKIDVDYGDRDVRTFSAGESFVEAVDYEHNGINPYDEPAEIITFSLESAR